MEFGLVLLLLLSGFVLCASASLSVFVMGVEGAFGFGQGECEIRLAKP